MLQLLEYIGFDVSQVADLGQVALQERQCFFTRLAPVVVSRGGQRAADAGIGEQAHYLGHSDALKSALTAGENLAFWADALGGDSARAAWIAALGRLGLAHVADFPARALSAGQKRRVALARLLVAPRPIWLLDEPTTALDAAAQRQFALVMREHLASGGLILAATHAPLSLDDAARLILGDAPATGAAA